MSFLCLYILYIQFEIKLYLIILNTWFSYEFLFTLHDYYYIIFAIFIIYHVISVILVSIYHVHIWLMICTVYQCGTNDVTYASFISMLSFWFVPMALVLPILNVSYIVILLINQLFGILVLLKTRVIPAR